jgi:excinuclease ABC subunit B
MFQLQSAFQPAGDQPAAINHILNQFESGQDCVTLLGATGTGKTFTMANIIQKLQKPTLIISHNKTLAAQLATEFKHFFPNNAVHYFVSYFDYYQPESYLPQKDIYIEKEATINKEIEMYRLSTLASLLSREDVIVVASVSALYGLGQKEFFEKYSLQLEIGQERDRLTLKKQLLAMQYKQVASKIEQGSFEFKGEILDIYSSTEKILFRVIFNEDTIETIQIKDANSFRDKGLKEKIIIWPSSQYIQDLSDLEGILKKIEKEMEARVEEEEKIYPGYVLVEMIVTDDSWFVVRNTPRVTGFVGSGVVPVPLEKKEVDLLFSRMNKEEIKHTIDLAVDDVVKITDGPFKDLEGKISGVDDNRGKVKVLVSMFGRETPVELDFLQVKKI